MANFLPLKNYIIYCLDEFIERFKLSPPFLDVGCGIADISRHLAQKGWQGKAIDLSDSAIKEAQNNLAEFKEVKLDNKSLFQEEGNFNTVLLMDVLEHLEDDEAALKKIASIISPKGHLILCLPSNPKEWRWDDDFYGHYRRYSISDITQRLNHAGFKPVAIWDFTYPFFWLLRRIYTRIKKPPVGSNADKLARTIKSSSVNAWQIPLLSAFLSRNFIFWKLLYKIQFRYFRNNAERGHEMIVLAQRTELK